MIGNYGAFTVEGKEGDPGRFLLRIITRLSFRFTSNAPLWTQRAGQYNSSGYNDDDKWTELHRGRSDVISEAPDTSSRAEDVRSLEGLPISVPSSRSFSRPPLPSASCFSFI